MTTFIEKEIYIPSLKTLVLYRYGKNAQGNFDIIDMAFPEDIWFHLSNHPSSHVIACTKEISMNKKQKQQVITQGALLCKQVSKEKKSVEVTYTKIQYLQKTGTLGSVLLSQCSTKKI